ncbi:RNA polymerase II transcription elongation factor-domain-containing protein [Aspergillus ambiguus]|uniref:ELL-associated factor n=1 Tax=Aspergillus ambiguus TaxID=176160 RepID=UPI003CCDEEDB
MATSTLSTGLIDPTKQAEYPIILGDRLAGQNVVSSQLINVQYNYRTKSSTARSVITPSSQSRNHYNLTITDKAPNAEQSLSYSYQGSLDPEQSVASSDEQHLVLVFDPDRKAFILEPVATQLNFNLRSAPAKTEKQVIEQYKQLRIIQDDDQGSGDDRASGNGSGNDEGPADDSNPYDFRHFLPKDNAEDDKSASGNATPEPQSGASKVSTPLIPATSKPAPSPKSRPKTQKDNPLRQPKRTTQAVKRDPQTTSKVASTPQPSIEKETTKSKPKDDDKDDFVEEDSKSLSDIETGAISARKAAPSPGSNIIIDGDLIIDMGSPPPSRPAFKVNPAHFSSNNTPTNDADADEDVEDLRLPSPAGQGGLQAPPEDAEPASAAPPEEEEADDDALAAEMEAAFEESAREEEARSQQSQQYHVPSEDESEVSEEE